MTIRDEINLYLRARVSLIVLVTVEEERALSVLKEVLAERDRSADLITWDSADQFRSDKQQQFVAASTPLAALEQIRTRVEGNREARDLYVLIDAHEYWGRPDFKRKLRNLSQWLRFTKSSVVIIAPAGDIPDELRDEAVIVDFPLPAASDLTSELDRLIASTSGITNELTAPGRERLAQSALGLTAAQARRAFAKAIVRDSVLDDRDIPAVLAEKKAVIRQSEALEYYAAEESPDDVGGLETLKHWLVLRERAFGKEAAAFGLPAPKGIALIGIPGTGKSLTAKMISAQWRLPLLRLDVGALFGSLVGESEERVRRALRLAETVAPCVLWIDELEKSLASGGNDGGTSQRVFGTLLTWMQEKAKPVFVVATANDVTALPPEVLRRGRFDEVFFLDLPTDSERREILTVHLRKRRRDPGLFDIAALAAATEGFVGAEIEQAVIDALYSGFSQGRDISTQDVASAAQALVPLSRSQREVIDGLRSWLRAGRAKSASYPEAALAQREQVKVEFEPLELAPPEA